MVKIVIEDGDLNAQLRACNELCCNSLCQEHIRDEEFMIESPLYLVEMGRCSNGGDIVKSQSSHPPQNSYVIL